MAVVQLRALQAHQLQAAFPLVISFRSCGFVSRKAGSFE
jgi:hypothetical protein